MFKAKSSPDCAWLPVIDFHSHILPEMDDGSRSVEMSLRMLELCRQMEVHIVLATPHFYGFYESVSDFLERRTRSWEKLSLTLTQSHPKILLGAEVTLFSGLTGLENLDALCLADTNALLLEMPFTPWTDFELDAVSTLCLNRGYKIILAHFERFLSLQRDKRIMESILQLPLYVQVNAGALCSFFNRKPALELFRSGRAQLLGSDCHNLDSRPPNLAAGRNVLQRKLGQKVLEDMDALGGRLLGLEPYEN